MKIILMISMILISGCGHKPTTRKETLRPLKCEEAVLYARCKYFYEKSNKFCSKLYKTPEALQRCRDNRYPTYE